MSRYVDALEEGVDGAQVLTQSDGEVAEAEDSQVQQLVWMESHHVMLVIAKYQVALVVDFEETQKRYHHQYLEATLGYDLPLVIE